MAWRRGRSNNARLHTGSGEKQRARTKYAAQATESEPEVSRRRLESKSLLGLETRAVGTLKDESRLRSAAEGMAEGWRTGR